MRSGETIAARKGVIIATGGYSANAEMSRDFEQIPGIDQEPDSLSLASLTGDGLVFGAEIGGIESLLTMVGGRIVYAAGPYAQLERQR